LRREGFSGEGGPVLVGFVAQVQKKGRDQDYQRGGRKLLKVRKEEIRKRYGRRKRKVAGARGSCLKGESGAFSMSVAMCGGIGGKRVRKGQGFPT